MQFSGLVVHNLARRKVRSALTCLGVALAVATVVSLVGFSSGLEQSSEEIYQGRSIDLVVTRAGVTQRLTSNLDEQLASRLKSVPGVREVNPSLTDIVSFGEGSLVGIPVHGWPAAGFATESLALTRGNRLAESDHLGVMLGESLAAVLGKEVGGQVEIELEKFRVVGIFAGANVYENMSAVVRLVDLQQLMDRPEQVTEFQLILAPGLAEDRQRLDVVRAKIEALADDRGQRYGLAAQPVREFVEGSTEMGLARAMSWGTSAIAVFIGSLGMWNTMMMSVLERTQEIGLLKALGWQPQRIVKMVVFEALLLCLAGAVLGVVGGWLVTHLFAESSALKGLLRPAVSQGALAASLVLAALMGIFGSALPAMRAARLSPVEALHYE
ncbi:MAG TPA: ABC transporter permease [Pirellulales bacterium]|nr:ABC transporter permease [Pirellulales bacterium]